MKPLLREHIKKRQNSRLAYLEFHHDNAQPHDAQRIITFFEVITQEVINGQSILFARFLVE